MNTDFMKGVIVPILTPIDENEWIDEIKCVSRWILSSMAVSVEYWPWKQRRILCDRRG